MSSLYVLPYIYRKYVIYKPLIIITVVSRSCAGPCDDDSIVPRNRRDFSEYGKLSGMRAILAIRDEMNFEPGSKMQINYMYHHINLLVFTILVYLLEY